MAKRDERLLAVGITDALRDGSDESLFESLYASPKRGGGILVVYGPGLGDFQTLSDREAAEYLSRLSGGERGAPRQMGIR